MSIQAHLKFSDLIPSIRQGIDRFCLAALLPLAAFYLGLKLSGAATGIACGMTISAVMLVVQARRLRRLDPVVLISMAVVLLQGSIALMLNSVELYLAAPAVENALWGLVLLGSVVARWPLIHGIAREFGFIPADHVKSAIVGLAMTQITIIWAIGAFAKAGLRLYLLATLSLEAFLVAIMIMNVISNGGLLAFSFWWTLRALRVAQNAAASIMPAPEGTQSAAAATD